MLITKITHKVNNYNTHKYHTLRSLPRYQPRASNIHALLPSLFCLLFLYFHTNPHINFIYTSAAICLCYVLSYAQYLTVSSIPACTSQKTHNPVKMVAMATGTWHTPSLTQGYYILYKFTKKHIITASH